MYEIISCVRIATTLSNLTVCFTDAMLNNATGTSLTNTAGTIQSPNYPMDYPPNADIWYTIVSQYVSKITIFFLDVNLETGYDFLRVGKITCMFVLAPQV
jgi:hypothetical protein